VIGWTEEGEDRALMSRTLPYIVAMALILGSGLVAGVRANRWRDQTALTNASARLDQLPLKFGDWEGEPGELPARIIEQSEVSGYLLRRYHNRRTNADVSIFLGCGRPGPVSVHSPEVCYVGGGYEIFGEPRRFPVSAISEGADGAFVVTDFRNPPSQIGGYLRIFWGLTTAGEWDVPQSPRLAFATAPVLFKLYVYRSLANPAEEVESDPCIALIRELLPELNKSLFPESQVEGPRGSRR
jgi:Protein of unknown function (DUF3485)